MVKIKNGGDLFDEDFSEKQKSEAKSDRMGVSKKQMDERARLHKELERADQISTDRSAAEFNQDTERANFNQDTAEQAPAEEAPADQAAEDKAAEDRAAEDKAAADQAAEDRAAEDKAAADQAAEDRAAADKAAADGAAEFLYVPMQTDNWIDSLSSGYLGGLSGKNVNEDFQIMSGKAVSGFSTYPSEEIKNTGKDGNQVVLKLNVIGINLEQEHSYFFVDDLIRVTRIDTIFFETDDEKNNYVATFKPFIEIPVQLIKCEVLKFEKTFKDTEIVTFSKRKINKALINRRENLDKLCGLVAQLVAIANDPSLIEFVLTFLNSSKSRTTDDLIVNTLLSSLLNSQKETGSAENIIWENVLRCLFNYRKEQGFDRLTLIENVADLIHESPKLKKLDSNTLEKVDEWIDASANLFSDERERPILSDAEGRIGRRAALSLLYNYDIERISNTKVFNQDGSLVVALSRLAAGAFQGFTRMKTNLKHSKKDFDGLLNIVEKIEKYDKCPIELKSSKIDPQTYTEYQEYIMDGKFAFKTQIRAPIFIRSLMIHGEKAKVHFGRDNKEKLYFFKTREDKQIFIKNNGADPDRPNSITFYIKIAYVNKKLTSTILRKILLKSGEMSSGVAYINNTENDILIASLTMLPDTLDQAEFDFIIGKLPRFKNSLNLITQKLDTV